MHAAWVVRAAPVRLALVIPRPLAGAIPALAIPGMPARLACAAPVWAARVVWSGSVRLALVIPPMPARVAHAVLVLACVVGVGAVRAGVVRVVRVGE